VGLGSRQAWGERVSALDVGVVDIGVESVGGVVEKAGTREAGEVVVAELGGGEMLLILQGVEEAIVEIEDMAAVDTVEIMEKITAGITMVDP